MIKFCILEINRHLGVQVVQYVISSMLLAVYAISISMVFCPIQHILEALLVYHSFREDRHRSSYLIVHQHGGCFLFPFVTLKVTTSHENALYKDCVVDMGNPDFGEPPLPNLYSFGDLDSPSQYPW